MKTLSIHQPNFFPWYGFFDKLAKSNIYYVFDHIQAPMGKSRFSRVEILLNGTPKWLTIPSKNEGPTMRDVYIVSDSVYIRKHLGTIKQAYSKSPYFNEVYPFLENIYHESPGRKLVDFNYEFIEYALSHLNIKTHIEFTSNVINNHPRISGLSGNELILQLAVYSKCDKYLSGTGCTDFIQPDTFSKNKIIFEFQNISKYQYAQYKSNKFINGLSILDCVMNIGWQGVRKMLHTCEN